MPAGDGDRWARDEHAWAGDDALVDSIAEREGGGSGRADIADGGESREDCFFGVCDAVDRGVGVGFLESAAYAFRCGEVLACEVCVGVDEPGEDEGIGEVDDCCIG